MSNRKRMRWLLAALALLVVAGFVAYDFRDRLPGPDALEAKAAEACAALPKPGREGRYQAYPACPWTVSVGPKQEFSGIIQPGEHGALFLPGDFETGTTKGGWAERYLLAPHWALQIDEKAARSLERLNADPFDPYGGLHRVRLRGWRTVQTGQYPQASYGKLPHVLFIDEFISVEPMPQDG
jgi:hypothetical protein